LPVKPDWNPRLAVVLLAGLVWAPGCGDGAGATGPPPSEPQRPTAVTVSPATAQLSALGATVRLTAEVRDQDSFPSFLASGANVPDRSCDIARQVLEAHDAPVSA